MLIQINKENMSLFTGVTSEESYELLEASFEAKGAMVVGIGACTDKGLITGCVLCEVTGKDAAEIRWIYVREPSRRLGFGREMISLLKGSLQKIGINSLSMIYTMEKNYPESEEKEDTTALSYFANAMGFESVLMTKDLYRVNLSDFRDACPKGMGKELKIVAASTIPSRRLLAYIKGHISEDNPALAIINTSSMDCFAPCSCACMNGENIDALSLFLEREDKEGVTLVYCDYNSIEQAISMLDRATKEALLTYKRSGIMSFTTMDGTGSQIIAELKCPAIETEVYEAINKL